MEERYGKLAIANIMTSIWLGDWGTYEAFMNEIPEGMRRELTFHSLYNRDEVHLWYDNHFFIPGEHFVSPYFSSYTKKNEDEEARRHELLCLIGLYEKTAFYFPLEQDRLPDHFGSMTAFMSSILQGEIKAEQEGNQDYLKQLEKIEAEMLARFIKPVLKPMLDNAETKITLPFFKEFLSFYAEVMSEEWMEAA
ncbi:MULTISPECIES: molecular chaperone TorD family protein [unclassified Mesobacillus]|uniref:molecular chaperone TorD family protein n=1 Tax=unclassified Mesobacillus TaxID=2675270 RepID=UPI00203BD2AC|nr:MULTISPECIES: molecular chaperone TorD family protein [unclassified Mesobacillus]MCM3124707.1 molecular chaperone TorD family protein [Mesobacillus sp. MER 33]MCM3234583.1 molecular chaperone TorD family protein [Mesobacillus sp. MER 48]